MKFGAQGSYLVDFFHACDYLSAAGKAIISSGQEQKMWMDKQKTRLTTSQANEVLQELQTHLESPLVQDSEAPVRQCHRYLFNRPEQLNEPDPVWWTPRSTKSVIHGRPVRSLATNRNRPAVGNAVPLIATTPGWLGMTRRASAARILPV